jgi:hypothetical protein
MAVQTDYFGELLKLIPPPKQPVDAGSIKKFEDVESQLGIQLPDVYKRLETAFGFDLKPAALFKPRKLGPAGRR